MTDRKGRKQNVRWRTERKSGRSTTAAQHTASATVLYELTRHIEVPVLPTIFNEDGTERLWHTQTQEWWEDMWSSPMAPEYHAVDIHGLYRLAMITDKFWTAPGFSVALEAAKEIRLAQKDYGMTPMDRRRLQWQIQATEKAQDEGARRGKPPTSLAAVPDDPDENPYAALA